MKKDDVTVSDVRRTALLKKKPLKATGKKMEGYTRYTVHGALDMVHQSSRKVGDNKRRKGGEKNQTQYGVEPGGRFMITRSHYQEREHFRPNKSRSKRNAAAHSYASGGRRRACCSFLSDKEEGH
jgi:hypothetical protein